jgi:hypothetical protein
VPELDPDEEVVEDEPDPHGLPEVAEPLDPPALDELVEVVEAADAPALELPLVEVELPPCPAHPAQAQATARRSEVARRFTAPR